MILVDAVYVNKGGGQILLEYLIETLKSREIAVHYLLDDRLLLENNCLPIKSRTFLRAGIFKRYRFYKKHKNRYKKVLCLGNIPPPIKLSIPVYTYFHQYLFVNVPRCYGWKIRIKYKIKYLFIKQFILNTNFWIVQTGSFKFFFLKKYQKVKERDVLVIPFYQPFDYSELNIDRNSHSFIYVSDGSPHKNHKNLLEAFIIFYNKFKVGELYLTVSGRFSELCLLIQRYQSDGYPIKNVGFLNRNELSQLYKQCKFSIYPSFAESFGLGILEAIENGCMIIGADLPYLHAVCKPSILFDPNSIESISKAFELAISKNINPSEIIASNNIDQIIEIFN